MIRRAALAAAVAGMIAAVAARADTLPPLTAEQASSLDLALRLSSAGLLGTLVRYTVTPADGFYELHVPLGEVANAFGVELDGEPLQARASLAADGVWHFDNVRLPQRLRVSQTYKPGVPPRSMTLSLREQSGVAVIDPTLKTRSSWRFTQGGIKQQTDGPAAGTATAAQAESQTEWLPASPRHVDIASVVTVEDFASHAVVPPMPHQPGGLATGAMIDTAVRSETTTVQLHEADPNALAGLMQQAVALLREMSGDRHKKLTDPEHAALRSLVAATRNIAQDAGTSGSVEGLVVSSQGLRVGLDRMEIFSKLSAPAGKFDLRLRMQVTGLDMPQALSASLRELVPHRVVLAPSLSGTPVEEVYGLLDAALDDRAEAAAVARERLAKLPATIGLDEMAFDLGPAMVTGMGSLTISGPAPVAGALTIAATGFDALTKRAAADPLLKQGAPVLIFLKGIGEQDGDRTVWRLAYKDGRFSVNDTDLSGLLPPQ